MHKSKVLLGLMLGLLAAPLAARATGSSLPPLSVRTMVGTLPPAGEGRRDFLKLNCYGCHGNNAGGGMAINIQHAGAGDIRDAVLNGEDTGMPSFRKYVTTTDIANIAAYLKSIGTKNEPKFFDWWVPVPTK